MRLGGILTRLSSGLALGLLLTTVAAMGALRVPEARAKGAYADVTADGLPNVQSLAAVVIDAKTGKVVFGKDADSKRHIASTGKIFVAMVVQRRGLDLDAHTEITRDDVDEARGGARTRLSLGHKFRNQDLLRAMLIASDNRAPTALGRAVGLSPKKLVAEMNALAKELGLKTTRFTSPSGLNGNVSTAREMSVALAAAMKDPFLASLMSTRDVTIRPTASRARGIHYRNTNKSLHSNRYEVLGGKTGFTDEAGYCLIIDAKIGSGRYQMSFLGAPEKLTRFGDFGRVARWLEGGGVSARSAQLSSAPRQ